MDYNNYFLKPQRKYVVRRGCLYLVFGLSFCWATIKVLTFVINFLLEVGVF